MLYFARVVFIRNKFRISGMSMEFAHRETPKCPFSSS